MDHNNFVRHSSLAHILYRVFILGCTISVLPTGHSEAATANGTQTVQQLRRRLDEQDAQIRDLQRKLDVLMGRIDGAQAQQPSAPEPAATAKRAQADAPAPPNGGGKAPNGEGGAKKGGAEVSATEAEAERALERTLTATGALLLPYGALEVQPQFSYVRRTNTLSYTDINGVAVPFDQDVKRNEFQPSVSARVGLPFDAELEAALPYNVAEQENVSDVAPGGRRARSGTGHGIGDFSIGVAKTIVRERGWRPDLIGRVTYNTGSGDMKDNNVPLNGGFSSVTGQVVALKRQDPLAFTASASYQKSFENNNIEPGDDLTFTLGAFLATSPDTSLEFSLQQSFVDDVKVNGRVVKDSDQVASTLNLGISSILGQNVLLLVSGGVGLTEDAPDYSVTVALPIRFPVPVPRLGQ